MTESQRPRVVIIGAGMSGLLMRIKLLEAGPAARAGISTRTARRSAGRSR